MVEEFLQDQYRVHYHLDWHPVHTWFLEAIPPSVVGYRLQDIIGLLLFTPPHQDMTWLRMAALQNDAGAMDFAALMQTATAHAASLGIQDIIALESDAWLGSLLLANRFRLIDKIIHMKRPSKLPPLNIRVDPVILLRPAAMHELDTILTVDHAAFAPFWQMQASDLQRMANAADIFSCAIIDGQLAGYLLATAYQDTVHLTRLATSPAFQRRGLATALIQHMLQQQPQKAVTVNTQYTNTGSQQLYKKLGFQMLSFSTPVWRRKISE